MKDIKELNALVKNYFEENNYKGEAQELYDPINYILSLGGKRVRPLMLLMSYNLYSDKIEKALDLAAAVEVFHNFTLIHDDIMDNAPLRRGQATVHEKWNDNTAILSGDAMLIAAYQKLENQDAEVLKKVLPVFNKTALEVCEGQQFDMEFESREIVSIDEYVRMIELKTSVLLGSAMKIGSLAAGASVSDTDALYNYGRFLGLAFQLQDDFLDLYGDKAKFGKRIGGDIVANKKTYLTITARNKANDSLKAKLDEIFITNNLGDKEEELKIDEVRSIYNQLGVVEDMKNDIDVFYKKAIESISQIEIPENDKTVLLDFAQNLIKRDA